MKLGFDFDDCRIWAMGNADGKNDRDELFSPFHNFVKNRM